MGVGHETPTTTSPAPAVEPTGPHTDAVRENRPDLVVRAQVGTPGGPDDGDAPRGPNPRHLATVLETLLTGDLDDPEGAVAGTIQGWPSLDDREDLWEDEAFWAEPFWGGTDARYWRHQVDPAPELVLVLLATPPQERAAAVATILEESPALRSRLRPHLRALDDGMAGLDRARLHHLLDTGEIPADDASLVRGHLLGGGEEAAEAADALRDDPALACAIAEDRQLFAILRRADPELAARLADAAREGLGSDASPTVDAAWADRVRVPVQLAVDALVRISGRSLGGYRDLGPAVLDALAEARAEFRALAVGEHIDREGVEERIAGAFALVVDAYTARAGSLLALLDRIDDPHARRRAAQILGREADGVATARAALAGNAAAGEAGEALDELVDEVAGLGAGLAEAVQAADDGQAASAATRFAEIYTSNRRSGLLIADDRDGLHQVLEAGYAPLGRDLCHGVATLDHADDVFKKLKYGGTALALRAEGDKRPDEVVQAEHDAEHRLLLLFRALVSTDAPQVRALLDGDQALLPPATLVAPDSPSTWLAGRYRATYGISIPDHLDRSGLPGPDRARVRATLDLSDTAPAPDQAPSDPPVLAPEYFQLPDGTPLPRDDVDAATAAHVDWFVETLGHLGSVGASVADHATHLTYGLARLIPTGGRQLVLDAYAAQTGASLLFDLQVARTRGDLDDTTAGALTRSLDSGDLHPTCLRLRGLADASQWDEVLAAVVAPAFAGQGRAALLDDGETLAYLRSRAPNGDAWDLFFRAAKGELSDAELRGRTRGLADWSVVRSLIDNDWDSGWNLVRMNRLGRGLVHAVDDDTSTLRYLLTGDSQERFDVDSERLLALRDQGLTGDALEDQRIERLLDEDYEHRLDLSVGQSPAKRMAAEYADLGQEHLGEALAASDDWDGRSTRRMRHSVAAMDEGERAFASEHAGLQEAIDVQRRPAAREELLTLLDEGEDGAHSLLLHAEGEGAERHQGYRGWQSVESLLALSDDELHDVAADPEQRERYRTTLRLNGVGRERVEALLAAADPEHTGTEADASRDLFVARHTARIVTAILDSRAAEGDLAGALLDLAADIEAVKDRRRGGMGMYGWYAVDGWLLEDAAARIVPPVHAALAAGDPGHAENVKRVLASALEGRATSLTLVRHLGTDEGTLLTAIDRAPDDLVAREWSSIDRPSRDGSPSLRDVYRDYRRLRQELAPDSPELADAQVRLATHRVDLAADALALRGGLLYAGLGLSGEHHVAADLAELDPALWDKAELALRERILSLPAALVHGLVGVAEEDRGLVWGASMRAGLVVAELSGTADRSLGQDAWVFDALSGQDNAAALHVLVASQELGAVDLALTDAQLADLQALAVAAGGTVEEYDAAIAAAAEVASWAASLAVTALAAAVTGPGAAPLAAQLIVSAASGLASVAVKEALLGTRYDATAGLQAVAVDLLTVAATAGMQEVWELARATPFLKELQQGRVGTLLLGIQTATQARLGPAGAAAAGSVLGAAAAVPVGHIRDSAWIAVQEGVVGGGWAVGLERGLESFADAAEGMPEELALAILEATAEALGEQVSGASDPDDAALRDKQHQARELRALLEARLGEGSDAVLEGMVGELVSGTAEAAVLEGWEAVMLGDVDISEDRVVEVLTSTAKEGVSTAAKEAGEGAAQVRAAHRQSTAVRSLDGSELELAADEREAFLDWVGAERVHVGDAQEVQQAVEQFRTQVWEPVRVRLDLAREEAGDAERFDAYERWVLDDFTESTERLDSRNYADFVVAEGRLREQLDAQRRTPGWAQLSEHERAWFDHAAQDPASMGELTAVLPTLTVRVDDAAHREAFQAGVEKASHATARRWVRSLADETAGTRQSAWLREHEARLARLAPEADPGDAGRAAFVELLHRTWQEESREAA